MSDDRNGDEHGERSWLEKIAQVFSSDPRTRKDLLDILVIAEQNDVIDTETHGIMQGALEVSHLQVRDVMIPRPQMVCLHSDEAPGEVVRRVIESGHSRYPVIGDSSDDVLGIVLAKDMLGQLFANGPGSIDITQLLRPATFIPESKRLNILWEAAAAIPESGIQKLTTNAAVLSHALAHAFNVCSDDLTQIRDLIHETDFHRQKSIGCIFDEFRGMLVHDENGISVAHKWLIEIAHQFAGRGVAGSNHHSFWFHEILHRRTFAKKFRVADYVKVLTGLQSVRFERCANLVRSSDGYSALRDD